MSPPEPSIQSEPIGAGLLRQSSQIRVTNSVWNGPGLIKRKVADYYVSEGRAAWLNSGQLRLIESHPKNKAALARAAAYHSGEQKSAAGERVFGQRQDTSSRHTVTTNRTAPGAKNWKQRCYKAGSGQFSSNRSIWFSK